MRLRYSPTSPYARKVLVTAIELGLDGRLDLVPTDVWAADTDIARDNPLGKVPALVTEEGELVYDSPVICLYLDSLASEPKLLPDAGRFTILRRGALADGLMDAAILRRLELGRKEGERSAKWADRQAAAMTRSLDALEGEAEAFTGEAPRFDRIAVACALAYLDFRFAHEPWRAERPRLAAWQDAWAERPSMRRTVPA